MAAVVADDTDGMEHNAASPSDTTHTIRVFVVEDSPYVRERLVDMLTSVPHVSVVGEADRPAVAIADICRTQPHIVLLDVHLIEGSGMEVLLAIRPRLPEVVFIVLTNYTEPIYRDACLKAGARFYLDKSHEFNRVPEIVASLRDSLLRATTGDTP